MTNLDYLIAFSMEILMGAVVLYFVLRPIFSRPKRSDKEE